MYIFRYLFYTLSPLSNSLNGKPLVGLSRLITFQAHDGEILTLTPIRSVDFVSTSLDQTVSVWFGQGGEGVDGKSRGNLPGPQEPIHCVAVNGDEVLTGSTVNRFVYFKESKPS